MVYANNLKPELNYEFTFRKPPQKGWNGITYCKVIDLEPLQKISYTYRGAASGEKALACAGVHSELADSTLKGIFTELDTVLSFTLTPYKGGTKLFLEHSGFKGFKLIIVSFIMAWGWKKLFRRLETTLQQINNKEAPVQKL